MMADKKQRRGALRLLTVREVLTAAEGDHFDGGGLTLRIRGGSAAWVFRYSSPLGRRREMGLGKAIRASAVLAGRSMTYAREAADQARLLVASGSDPIDAREAESAGKEQAVAAAKASKQRERLTLARVCRNYHERVIEPNRTAKHAAQWIASLENHLGDMWNDPIATIQQDALLDRLIELNNEMPETASRIRQRLEAVFDDAVFRKAIVSNPASVLKRKLREVGSKRKRGHFRALPHGEVPALWNALAKENGTAAPALRLLILTASRTGEILGAAPSEFDLEAAIWRVPATRMKAAEEHAIHLSAAATRLVSDRLSGPTADPDWLFPSPTMNSKPLSNMALLNLLRRMGLHEATTAHGLRASFSTWANESGRYRSDVIEACLAHREGDLVRRAYNRAEFAAERRQLMADWSSFVTSGAPKTRDRGGRTRGKPALVRS